MEKRVRKRSKPGARCVLGAGYGGMWIWFRGSGGMWNGMWIWEWGFRGNVILEMEKKRNGERGNGGAEREMGFQTTIQTFFP